MSFKDFKGFKKVENIKERYKFSRIIGEGNFAHVRVAMHKAANMMVAVKIISKDQVDNDEVAHKAMQNELAVLEDVDHPNIMRVYELLHDERNYYIVSEYMREGELYEYIRKRKLTSGGAMTEDEVRRIAFQIFYALNYMHNKGITHRDLKPSNILVDSVKDSRIKIADFGYATYKKESGSFIVSPIYQAPEIILHRKSNSKADIWSAGVIVYTMLCGIPPFSGNDAAGTANESAILEQPLRFISLEWQAVSESARDFLLLALAKDPESRLSAAELLQHPWLCTKIEHYQSHLGLPLKNVSDNLANFAMATDFQKVVISLIGGLKVQRDELRQLQQMFMRLDRDKNGTLSREELEIGLADCSILELFAVAGEDERNLLMERLDLNNDGQIEYSEFINFAIDHQAILNNENIGAAFKTLDQNGDGMISFAELEETFRGAGMISLVESRCILQELLKAVDTDNDGHITIEEFSEAMRLNLKDLVQ